ncbi:alanine racemase [Anaerocolumna sp. AGMB13020]|uniref:alanine racemase n=1 Tax=Anaerocolumna sp. AGMB13020 TaxID=3081750 RepID=UPI002955CF55|nr:alanine racemase [Anaerocolumna sp. AGMB13020]WOO36841.1 alanine racemase [Anaerocolumna sp. AGMB13020]
MNHKLLFLKENMEALLGQTDTPFYVYSLKVLKENIQNIKRILSPEVELCYSIKANPMLVPYVQELVDYFEVCSMGEYKICKEVVTADKKIIYGGICKKKEEIRGAVLNGQVILTVESMTQLRHINQISKEEQRISKVLLRISPGNQFGLSQEDMQEVLRERDSIQNLQILGAQLYASTQCFKVEEEKKQIESLFRYIYELEEIFDFTFKIVDYGGGVGVPYYEGDTGKGNPEELLSEISGLLLSHGKGRKIIFEAGRIIPASCGIYVSRVLDQKTRSGRTYSILDGGTNHIKYFGQAFGGRNAINEVLSEKEEKAVYTVCGPLCTANDILLKDVEVSRHTIDDFFVFLNAGAYCQTEASALFLSRDLPAVFIVKETNEIKLVRKNIDTFHINGGL